MEEVEAAPKGPPKFTSSLLSVPELVEGQPSHFETTVEVLVNNLQLSQCFRFILNRLFSLLVTRTWKYNGI